MNNLVSLKYLIKPFISGYGKHSNTKENRDYKYLYKELKHAKRRQKRGNIKDTRVSIPNRVYITQPPEILEQRKRVGDLEADLMMGKDHKSGLLVLNRQSHINYHDRKTKRKNSQRSHL